MANIRKVNFDDYSALQNLWTSVFHDDEFFLSAFFSTLAPVMEAFAAEQDGQFIGAAYILDIFTFKNGETALPCPYIYAVGVHPEFRGLGIGKALTAACRDYCAEKYSVSCLVPAGNELFEYYKHAGYIPAFYVSEHTLEREGAINAKVSEITPEKYGELREQLLSDRPHMEYSIHALRFLEKLCDIAVSGLYLLQSGDNYAIAAVENTETMFIKELLCSNDNARGFAAALLWHEDCDRLIYRTPANEKHPESTKALGMLSNSLYDGPIYMGPAFD